MTCAAYKPRRPAAKKDGLEMHRETGQFHKIFRQALRCCLFCTLWVSLVHAQGPQTLPTKGKRFWTGFVQNGFGAQSLRVHIMSTTTTSGTVSMPLLNWSTTFNVAANGVAVVNLPLTAENQGSEVAGNKGVLIEAQDSVDVFISSFQNFTHDLSQVLPEETIGDSYRVDSYHGIPNFNNLHKSELLIVATQDGTQIKITPKVPTAGGHPANVPFIVNLNAGQTYQVQAATDVLDLTGTLVEATESSGACRPFAVIGGSMCATLPGACSACDVIFEQLIPRKAWGTRYYTAPINGVNHSTYRILADENNTSVTIGNGAPIILNAGQKHEVNGQATPVCIQSSKPVSVVQLLEGVVCAGSGDPSMLILSPHDRLTKTASFHTPTSPQLSQHSIGLVVPLASVGQVTLNGNVISPALFQTYPGCNDRRHAKLTVPAGVNHLAGVHGFQLYMFGIGNGESYAASVNSIGSIPVQQDSSICGSTGPLTLTAMEPLQNAEWTAASDPNVVIGTGNSITVTTTSSDSYTVTGIQQLTGCSKSFTYHIGMPLSPQTAPIANGESAVSVCQYEQVQLGLYPPPDPQWFEFTWSPASSLDDPHHHSPTATPTTNTWYKVEVTSPSGCGSLVDSVFVEVSPGQILDLQTTATPAVICAGNSTNLTSKALRVIAKDLFDGAPASFWSAVLGGNVSAACGSVSGQALYFNGNGQRYAQTNAFNTIGGGRLRFHLKIANGTAPCDDADPGENVVLEYSTTNGVMWSTLSTYDENAYPQFTPIEVNIPAAAQSNNTIFRLRQLANSGAGQDNWALDEFIFARYDDTYLSYQWTPSNVVANATAHATAATPASTQHFLLSGTDPSSGCAYKDSVLVTVDPAFQLQVSPDTTLCAVAGVQLHAAPIIPASATYVWSPATGLDDPHTAAPIATPSSTTTYSVTATSASGCVATGNVVITVGQLLDLDVSAADLAICQGQQVQLNATASGGSDLVYSWSNSSSLDNAASPTPIATPTQSTTYTCTVTHTPSGCSLQQSVTIHVTTGYNANAGADVTVCSALGHQLHVQHNVPNPVYQWSPAANLNAANIQSPTILNDASATYTVTITDGNGCSVSDQIVVTRAFQGVPAQLNAAACADAPPTLTAPANAVSYHWNTGETTASITPQNGGAHTVTMTNAQGCQAITTFHVVLHPLPVVDLGPDVSLCGANSHMIDAGAGGTGYAWSNGQSGQSITVNSSGTYAVTVTNVHGCSASDALQVQFDPLPGNTLENVTACITSPPTLDAGNPGASYSWSTGATTQSIVADASGMYEVTITSPENCTATYLAQVTLAPQVQVDLGPDTMICQGGSLLLDAGQPGNSYLWSNQAITQTISVNNTGTYGVEVSNGYCTAYDAIHVLVAPLPIDPLMDITTCEGTEVILDAGNEGAQYLWNTGETTRSIQVVENGTYSAIVTNGHGCSRTMDAIVTFVAPPVVDLGPDTVLCDGETLLLDAANAPASYEWNTGATIQAIPVTATGAYSVSVSNGYCVSSDIINVYFNEAPTPFSERLVHVCLEEEPHHVLLDAGNTGSTFLWNTGQNGQTIRANAYGWYGVRITNVFGCQLTDSIEVVEYCPSTIFAPNTFTPNGDGLNDTFMPVGRNIATMELRIFDRWGHEIFHSTDMSLGWDGRYRGEMVTDDVFVWKANYRFYDKDRNLGMEHEMTGQIMVLK